MWFLAPKKFPAKSVEKWPKFDQKTLSRSKKGQKCGFGPEFFFQPNRSKNGQKTLSRPKNGQKCGFLPPPSKKNSAKLVKKWPKHGQKMFSRSKRIEKVVLGLKKNSVKLVKKWPKYGHTHTHTHIHTHTHMFGYEFAGLRQNSTTIFQCSLNRLRAHLTDCGLF